MATEQDKTIRCNVCGESHTKDEIVLKANKDLLAALSAIPELTERNAEALHTVNGAILNALDALEKLDVPGFKHPEPIRRG